MLLIASLFCFAHHNEYNFFFEIIIDDHFVLKNSSLSLLLDLCLHHFMPQLQQNTLVYGFKYCLQIIFILCLFCTKKSFYDEH